MYQDTEQLYYSELLPVFDSFVTVRETDEETKVKRFLLEFGFVDSTPYITDCLAYLVTVCVKDPFFAIGEEYAKLSKTRSGKDAFSLMLNYYLKKNHEEVRKAIKNGLGYDIGEKCGGNKHYIRKLAVAYSMLIKEDGSLGYTCEFN